MMFRILTLKWRSCGLVALFGSFLMLAGCGGGAGVAPVRGVVKVFGPVSELHFETATQRGVTDADGAFAYLPGETVTFRVGDHVVGDAVLAAAEMTLVDLVPGAIEPVAAADCWKLVSEELPKTERMVWVLSLLRVFDQDKSVDNGIQLHPELLIGEVDETYPIRSGFFAIQMRKAMFRAVQAGQIANAKIPRRTQNFAIFRPWMRGLPSQPAFE